MDISCAHFEHLAWISLGISKMNPIITWIPIGGQGVNLDLSENMAPKSTPLLIGTA